MSGSNCCFLTCLQISQEACKVVRGRIFQFPVFHTVIGFGIVNKAEVDVLLEPSCFFCHPTDVGNLISSCAAFSKSILNIWKFTVQVLLEPGLENFEYFFASIWDELQLCSSVNTLWHCLSLELEWKLTFSSPVATAEFSKFAGNIECGTFTASCFRIWNSSGIP